ncbi:hypothetical protein NMG60_11031050 [Bertholletia excelsa]
MSQVSMCSKCGGDGKIITAHCRRCGGQGKVKSKRNIRVVIPPGVNDGATMQVQGEGNTDNKRGLAGDLFIVLHVNKKEGIWRDGLDLYSKISVDYTEAILGAVIKVETVEGLKDLQIPSGIQPGDAVKIPHLGVPDVKKPSKRGDHHFIVNVRIPQNISNVERELVEKLASFQASCSPSKGEFDNQTSKHASSHWNKHIASLWGTIKDSLGRRQSGKGFASLSIETSAFSCCSPSSTFMTSISVAFIATCIFMLAGKLICRALLQRIQHFKRWPQICKSMQTPR